MILGKTRPTLSFFDPIKYRRPIIQTHFLILIKFCELRMLLIFYSCPFELELENVCRLKHRSFALYPLLWRVTILWWLIILRRWLIVKTNGDSWPGPEISLPTISSFALICSTARFIFSFQGYKSGLPGRFVRAFRDENRTTLVDINWMRTQPETNICAVSVVAL